jgi:hypothetical protein
VSSPQLHNNVNNPSAEPREVRLDVGVKESARKEADRSDDHYLVNLIGTDHSDPDASGKHCFLLEPYGISVVSGGRSGLHPETK